ncbi:MAG: hypothetical protein ACK4N5_25120, partial [Myxococcales bacterium]
MRTVCASLLLLTLLAPSAAIAEAPAPPPAGEGREAKERLHKRVRLMRLVELAERVELDDRQALKVNEILGQYDDKKHAVREQMQAPRQLVQRAAQGDAEAAKGLDAAVDQLIALRKRLLELDHEAWKAASRELTPKQRAKLAV